MSNMNNLRKAKVQASKGWVAHHETGAQFPVASEAEALLLLNYMDTCHKSEGPLKDWEVRDARIQQVLREGTREEQVACALESRVLFNSPDWLERFGFLKISYWTPGSNL
jgi:hypothetical protein